MDGAIVERMDHSDARARRDVELRSLPQCPPGGPHRAVVLDDGTAETYLVMAGLRARGWAAVPCAASRAPLQALLDEHPLLLVVTTDHTQGRGELAVLLREVRTGPTGLQVVNLSGSGSDNSRPLRRLRVIHGVRRGTRRGSPREGG